MRQKIVHIYNILSYKNLFLDIVQSRKQGFPYSL